MKNFFSNNFFYCSKIFHHPAVKLARINSPAGFVLLAIPSLIGIILSAKITNLPNNEVNNALFLFLIGAFIMRCAGCIINDLLDAKFDCQVARTKNRPLASGAVSSNFAIFFLSILLFCSLIILLQFNLKTIIFGCFLLFLIVTYPLFKRFTFYPQLFLGLVFNSPIIMASFALLNYVSVQHLIIYCATIIWTIIYDTIYAFQDIEDDMKIGVKSTAIKFGNNSKLILKLLALLQFIILSCAFLFFDFSWQYLLFILLFIMAIAKNINSWNLSCPNSSLNSFKRHQIIGCILIFAILLI